MFRTLSMALLLALAFALPGNAQQVLKVAEADPEHVFIHLNLGSLHTAWRSVGANRWEVQDKDRAWVAFPPEGTEIRYCHCGSGGTTVILRVPRAHVALLVPSAQLDEAFAAIRKFPWHPVTFF